MSVWHLDPEWAFLNHGSFGACPRPVLAEQQRWRERLESQPVRFLIRELEGAFDAAREVLAAFVDAAPEDLVRVGNATEGVNTVLRCLPWERGDELLITSHGYNACNNAAAEVGATVVVAEVPFPLQSPQQVVDAVLAKVTPRTRLALLDHVTSPTGVVFPLERLIPALHERGVKVLVDGAHAPGMVPLSLKQLDPDWYTGNLHKWVCAPKAAAFLYARRSLQPVTRPLVVSHGATVQREGRSRFLLEFDWPGTFDPTVWLSVPKALEVVGGLRPGGWPQVRETNRALALAGRDVLLQALGVEKAAPDEMIGSLAAVVLPQAPGNESLQQRLFDQRIEVPVFRFGAHHLLRISAQQYNSLEQYQRLARTLPAS